MSTSPPPLSHRQLLAAARKLLAGLGARGLQRRGAPNDAFEFWLWALTIREANSTAQARVTLRNQQRGMIRLRTSPGQRSDPQYTYAELTSTKGAVDLHTGIYVTGRSGARHELDVVALEHGAPGSTATHTAFGDVQWAMEAKLYAPKPALPLSIPRAALGTAYDIGVLSGFRGRQKSVHPEWRFADPLMMLVTSTRLSADGRTLLGPRSGRNHETVAIAESVTSTNHTNAILNFVRDKVVDI